MNIEEIAHNKYEGRPEQQQCFCEGAFYVLEEIENIFNSPPCRGLTTEQEIRNKMKELFGEHLVKAKEWKTGRQKGNARNFWERY